MEYIEKIKKMLCKELDEYAMKGKISGADLDMIWKLTDTVKNLDKIEMLEEEGGYSEGSSYGGGSSYRRGRGRNARRDSMGRYSRDMMYSEDDYSEDGAYDRGNQGGRSMGGRNYSRDDAKDHMMSKLGEMMEDADPNEREILKDAMRKLEKA